MRKRRFDFNSAYGQLIVMVFLPITILACVGVMLVHIETSKTIVSRQQTLAISLLIRYEPAVKKMMPDLLAAKTMTSSTVHQDLTHIKNQFANLLITMHNDQHVKGVAIIDEAGSVLASDRDFSAKLSTDVIDPSRSYPSEATKSLDAFFGSQSDYNPWKGLAPSQTFMAGVDTHGGTAYGHQFLEVDGRKYWLFVDMDNEPSTIAHFRVWLALGLSGLFTLLFLLLSLNIYAKRWVVPIYDMRLHLQKITANSLHYPIHTDASGELNQLQQTLAMTLRRLHTEFQELRVHANQTEEDLNVALDEMEMQNILIREDHDKAISTSQMKSAFLANISHELRTPLNSIDGFINLLARHGGLSPEQDLYVQTIRKSSAHLLALVNDVLDFSKIEAGKLVLDVHELDLYATVYDVMDMLSPLAQEKGLRMAIMYYDDVPHYILGDTLRIKQVLTNLIGNAIKFTETGDVIVRVSLDAESDDEMIMLAVQDSGQGVSEEQQHQLFQSFHQGDPSVTRQFGGTGLGLVISKQLTRLMGGAIGYYPNSSIENSLSSAEGIIDDSHPRQVTNHSGSTFWFSLPAHSVQSHTLNSQGQQKEKACDKHGGNVLEGMKVFGSDTPWQLPTLSEYVADNIASERKNFLVWLQHAPTLRVFMASMQPLLERHQLDITHTQSLAGTLDLLKERQGYWDWVIIDDGYTQSQEDQQALLKQIRLHYQGELAVFGYQVALDTSLLSRYHAKALYQPLDRRQLYQLLDTKKREPLPKAEPVWTNKVVLAVDDYLPNLLVLEALLSELGIEVITANSGTDALNIISQQLLQTTSINDSVNPLLEKQKRIDLIFMDIQMPKLSGHDTTKQIRKLEQDTGYPTIPIIGLSAHGLADEKQRLLDSGMNDYVGKPISQPQLLYILQRWLGDGSLSTLSAHSQPSLSASNDIEHEQKKQKSQKFELSENQFGTVNEQITDLPIVDWKDALSRSANKPELAKQLLIMMQDTLEDELHDLSVAWRASDREELAKIAHRILGASRYTGVPQIRDASQNLEDKCLLNPTHVTPTQLAMLEPYYEALVLSLKRLQTVNLKEVITNLDNTPNENDMTWKMI